MNERMSIFPQVLSVPVGAIFEEANYEMTKTMRSHVHLYKELKKEQVGEEFM